MISTIMLASCSNYNGSATPAPITNQAAMITDKAKLEMIHSLVDLEGNKGRIYEVDYTVDYKLDEALNFGIDGVNALQAFMAQHLFDVKPQASSADISFGSGCSAFACRDTLSGDFIMGRNFDFNHIDPATKQRIMIPLIAVHTAPAGGKKAVAFADGLFVGYTSGFYTDGKSDLSMLMALPYLMLDGINEDGLAVSVLKLDGLPTQQHVSGKKTIFTTVAMRLLLDRAASVKEAIALLKDYNMCIEDDPDANYHLFVADASGDFAIIEYTNPDTAANPDTMEVLSGDDRYRYVTNFYASPSMAQTPYGCIKSLHGKDRYNHLSDVLKAHNYIMTPDQARDLLELVSQGPDDDQSSTGFTQWSEVFNLTKRELSLSILREWHKSFHFKVK